MFQQSRLLFLSATLAAVVYVCYAWLQPVYTYAKTDPRLDAHQYAAMYDHFSHQTPHYQVKAPFNSRILVPFVAAHLPFKNKIQAFKWLNGLLVVLTVLALVMLWLRLQIRTPLIFVALFWVLFHWKGLVRMYLPDPITGDVAGYFLLTLLLLVIPILPSSVSSQNPLIDVFEYLKIRSVKTQNEETAKVVSAHRFVVLSIIMVLGVLQKESFLVIIAVVFGVEFLQKKSLTYLPIVLFSIIIYLIINYLYPPSIIAWRNSPFVTVFRVGYRYLQNPMLILTIFTSWLMAYGLFSAYLVRVFFQRIKTLVEICNFDPNGIGFAIRKRTHFVPHLTVLAITWFLLSIFGGGDTARIAFNGLPIILTFILLQLNKEPNWVAYFFVAASLPLMRLGRLEPDLGVLKSQTYDWCVECWTWADAWPWWVYAAVVLAIYYYLLRQYNTINTHKPNDISTRSNG